MLHSIARPLFWLLITALPASAHVYVVDDDGGAGVDFTDLPTAVATVRPGDVLRVMPGTYSGFTLDKGLTIVGQPGGAKWVTSRIWVQNVTNPAERVVLAGLSARDGDISNCARPVLILSSSFASNSWDHPAMFVGHCADVRMQQTTIAGGNDGLTAMEIQVARVQLSDCSVTGADGEDATFYDSGGWGGNAVHAHERGIVHAYSSTLRGGNGGDSPFYEAGHGGDALTCYDALLAGPLNLVQAGIGGDGAEPGLDGIGLVYLHSLRTSSTQIVGSFYGPPSGLEQPVPEDPSLVLATAIPQAGQPATLVVHAPAGVAVDLVLGRTPVVVDLPGMQEDVLVVELRRIHLGIAPANGTVSYDFLVPAGLDHGYTIFAQAEAFVAAGDVRHTNSVSVVLR